MSNPPDFEIRALQVRSPGRQITREIDDRLGFGFEEPHVIIDGTAGDDVSVAVNILTTPIDGRDVEIVWTNSGRTYRYRYRRMPLSELLTKFAFPIQLSGGMYGFTQQVLDPLNEMTGLIIRPEDVYDIQVPADYEIGGANSVVTITALDNSPYFTGSGTVTVIPEPMS